MTTESAAGEIPGTVCLAHAVPKGRREATVSVTTPYYVKKGIGAGTGRDESGPQKFFLKGGRTLMQTAQTAIKAATKAHRHIARAEQMNMRRQIGSTVLARLLSQEPRSHPRQKSRASGRKTGDKSGGSAGPHPSRD